MSKAQVDFLLKLKKKKYRDQHQKFLIENPKVIFEEYQNPLLDSVYVTDKFFDENEDVSVFKNVVKLSEKDFAKISNQVNPQGLAGLFDIPKEKEFTYNPKDILLLDGIQDPGNLGTIIRTADWFGFRSIFLSQNCVEAYNPKVIASTMGSIFNVNIFSDVDLLWLIPELKKARYTLVVTDLAGDKNSFAGNEKIALVIGNEAKGVSVAIKEKADKRFKILKYGQAESLNASVAAGILMYQIKS